MIYNILNIYFVKLFILCEYLIPMLLEDFFFSKDFDIRLHHFCYHLCDRILTFPAEFRLSFRGISEKEIYLSRSEISWIDFDETDISSLLISFFFDTDSPPLDLDTNLEKCPLDKLSNTVRFARCKNKIFWIILLEHEPHALHVIFCMSPIPLRIEIAYIEIFLESEMYPCYCPRNFTSHKCFTTYR